MCDREVLCVMKSMRYMLLDDMRAVCVMLRYGQYVMDRKVIMLYVVM